MELIQEIIIDKPIEACWDVLGNQFTEIYKWASPVHHANGDGKTGVNGASCTIRGCEVQGMGEITEELTEFDPKNYFLAYEIITGLPNMMKAGKNSWKLTPVNSSQTKLNMKGAIETKGLIAKLMRPMIKMQFDNMTKNIVEEFKYYVETGQPHPRKVKATKKMAA